MKKMFTLALVLSIAMLGNAQKKETDSVPVKRDTVKIGGITVVIKKSQNGKAKEVDIFEDNDSTNVKSSADIKEIFNRRKKKSNVSTDWISFDFGFNTLNDKTNYSTPNTYLRAAGTQPKPGVGSFDLKSGKSLGVNFWLVKQKVNIAREYLGIKYAIGIEHLNYRFENNISFLSRPNAVINDSVGFSKNKLGVNYLTVPIMLYINPDGRRGFSFSAGVSAGYKINSFNKQRSAARGKDKNRGEFDLNPLKLAVVGDVGYKKFRVFASYGLTNLFKDRSVMDMQPITVGLRWARW